ncbi:GNAT family N-acetyltransferase [Streptacidiphilus sp. EB129]|uniref:GNAT family N-acetyltransferase n=1 Tax=Streptacidiphilus sp. EB129 TaxID=3156262 RepID=UPI0035136F8B
MFASPRSTVPARVAAYMRADITRRSDHLRVGPFLAALNPHTATLGRNFAVPMDGARPSPAEVAALVAAFERHDRIPRLEYVTGAAPEAEVALIRAGFTVDGRLAMLACPSGAAIDLPLPAGIALSAVTEAGDLRDAVDVQNEAYGEPASAGSHDLDRLQALIGRGGLVALARDAATGRPCGAGLVTEPQGGVSEVAAVATRMDYRRRGIASALASLLTRAAHDGGAGLVFLDVEGPAEELVYLRAGFARAGERAWVSLH